MSQTKRKKAETRSDRARNWKENLHDLPEPLLNEVVKEIDMQEASETKTVAQLVYTCKTLRNTRYCKACMGKCEYDDEPTFLGRWVSEAEHQAKIKEIEANELKAIKLAEKLVGENAKLIEMLNDNVDVIEDFHEIILAQDGRLEAIKEWQKDEFNWYENCLKTCSECTTTRPVCEARKDLFAELGVLLNPTEKNDVEVSRQEIRQGQSKKFTKAEELLKELKKGEAKKP